jgi:hypothetical protein
MRSTGQQLRLFNAHYDDYGFQPIVVFDQDGRFVSAPPILHPAASGDRPARQQQPFLVLSIQHSIYVVSHA